MSVISEDDDRSIASASSHISKLDGMDDSKDTVLASDDVASETTNPIVLAIKKVQFNFFEWNFTQLHYNRPYSQNSRWSSNYFC
jgi:hypothetical protein